jgi:prepilin-type processing-associated H-X9-DG protein
LLFSATSGAGQYFPVDWTSYVLRLRNYVGLKGDPSPGDRLLACPCDDFCFDFPNNGRPLLVQRSIHFLSNWNWTSYCFDAGNAVFRYSAPAFPGMFPGVLGSKLSSIRRPDKTVLVAEYPARDPFSWHQRERKDFINNSPNNAAFADGHAKFNKMYFGPENPENTPEPAYLFDPPVTYDYKWSGK